MPALSEQKIRQTILDLATPLVEALGLVIWGLELVYANRAVVRLYIDDLSVAEQGDDSALNLQGLDACTEVSRQLGLALDVEDIFAKAWVLEVSTPGLDRTFFAITQMQNYIGDVIEAKLKVSFPPEGGRKLWRGTLISVSENAFSLKPCEINSDDRIVELNDPIVTIPWDLSSKVHRVALFPKPLKPGKGSR